MIITDLEKLDRNKTVQFKQIYADNLIRMKKYDEAYTMIGPSLDKYAMPVTGLTEDYTPPRVAGKVQKTVKGTRKIMEGELDLEEGTLKQKSVFWHSYNVRVGSQPVEMHLLNPTALLQYLFLIAQSNVANGYEEVGKTSAIEFVLFSEEDEAALKVEGRKTLKQAYALSDKLDNETKMHILAVHGILVDASSTNTIENKIDEIIERNPAEFLAHCEDDILIYKSLVTMCLDKGILVMKEGAIFHKEVNVGYSKDNAASIVSKDGTLQAILKAKLSGDMDLIRGAISAANTKK
jgi:hypothetical protein